MGKTAIILGATGLTGSLLLEKLLQDNRYDTVKIFTRKSVQKKDPKLKEFIGDLLCLENFVKDFTGDELYCCIGTTAKKTPDKTSYKNIDFGIPVIAAKLCKQQKITTFLVISAIGANPESSIFYSRIKGEMEQAILREEIPNTYILRPSIIAGDRNENRIGEKIGILVTKFLQFLLVGKLKKYRLIGADKIALAMIQLANAKPNITIIPSDKIETLSAV
jgi:uncharacterized protein YbjT (DUF2867 family)